MPKKPIIVDTDDVLGGAPRLNGTRLAISHVLWGITEYSGFGRKAYQRDFEVTDLQLAHAISYCKDQMCEKVAVRSACHWCTKRFEEESSVFSTEDEFEDHDWWKVAGLQHSVLKDELDLPNHYDELGNGLVVD